MESIIMGLARLTLALAGKHAFKRLLLLNSKAAARGSKMDVILHESTITFDLFSKT